MRILFALVISLSTIASIGQSHSELILNSSDSVAFFLAIDGVSVSDSAQIKFEIVTRTGEVLLDIVLSDSTGKDLSTSITMAENIRTAYEITDLRTGLALLQVSRELIEFEATLPDDPTNFETDSSLYGYDSAVYIMNSNVALASKSLTIALVPATDVSEYNELCTTLSEGYFEKEKSKQALEFVVNYKHTVINLVHILELLGYEDNRLIVAKRAFSKLVDPENFLITLDYFHLERSKKELEHFFNDQAK